MGLKMAAALFASLGIDGMAAPPGNAEEQPEDERGEQHG